MKTTTSTRICFVFFHFESSFFVFLFISVEKAKSTHTGTLEIKKMETIDGEDFKNYT